MEVGEDGNPIFMCKLELEMVVKFFKGVPSWQHTCYVLGVPRSGKSTILNLLGTVDRVEILDEPFEIQLIAQKGGRCEPGSELYEEYMDSYMALLENSVSELVLGRRYNLRRNDKSCVYNVKSAQHVDRAFSRSRRLDAIEYIKNNDLILAMAFNDLESSLPFIVDERIPRPKIIHIVRDIEECIVEVDKKGWLSDEQLATLTNLSPGYKFISSTAANNLYLPYVLNESQLEAFISASDRERATMFISAQHDQLTSTLSNITDIPILRVMHNHLLDDPEGTMNDLFSFMDVVPTEITMANVEQISQHRHR